MSSTHTDFLIAPISNRLTSSPPAMFCVPLLTGRSTVRFTLTTHMRVLSHKGVTSPTHQHLNHYAKGKRRCRTKLCRRIHFLPCPGCGTARCSFGDLIITQSGFQFEVHATEPNRTTRQDFDEPLSFYYLWFKIFQQRTPALVRAKMGQSDPTGNR